MRSGLRSQTAANSQRGILPSMTFCAWMLPMEPMPIIPSLTVSIRGDPRLKLGPMTNDKSQMTNFLPPGRSAICQSVPAAAGSFRRAASTPNSADAGCNSKLAQYSPPATLRVAMRAGNTPSLRVAGFEDEDSLSDVAFCARCLAVLSASEVGRTKRLTRSPRSPISDRFHRKGMPVHGLIHDFPYLEQVSKHFETIAHHPHLGLGRIRPMHRHLHHDEIHRLRQEQDLDIKGEAVNLLSFKNFTRSLRPEPFEPALGIQKLETGQSADHPIESVAHQLTHGALMLQNLAIRVFATANNQVDLWFYFE